jgi:hypothetical protein
MFHTTHRSQFGIRGVNSQYTDCTNPPKGRKSGPANQRAPAAESSEVAR